MKVLFIGGCADGEVKEFDTLEPRYYFRKVPTVMVKDLVAGQPYSPFDIIKLEQDEYYLDNMVSYEKKYWFYIHKDIKREDWVEWLVNGYLLNLDS